MPGDVRETDWCEPGQLSSPVKVEDSKVMVRVLGHLRHSHTHIATESHHCLLTLNIRSKQKLSRETHHPLQSQVSRPRHHDGGVVDDGQEGGGGDKCVPDVEVTVPGLSLTASRFGRRTTQLLPDQLCNH